MQRTGSEANVLKRATGIVMMQVTAKTGTMKHDKVTTGASIQDFLQLGNLGSFLVQGRNKLASAEQRGALRASSARRKERGKIKGRTVTDGRAQRQLRTKEEMSLPTVSTDALMLSIVIDALERGVTQRPRTLLARAWMQKRKIPCS
jgi:hypothetical protein